MNLLSPARAFRLVVLNVGLSIDTVGCLRGVGSDVTPLRAIIPAILRAVGVGGGLEPSEQLGVESSRQVFHFT